MLIYRNEHAFCGPISMLARLAGGELVLVFREARRRAFVTHADPTTRTSLIRSSDDGRTWHSQVSPDPGGGNGTTVTQLADGALLVSNFHWRFVPAGRKRELQGLTKVRDLGEIGMAGGISGIHTTFSHTDGYTWESPRKVDVVGLQPPTTAGRVVQLADGTLVMPINARRGRDEPLRPYCTRSTDMGDLGGLPIPMCPEGLRVPDLHETRMTLLPDGRLLALMRVQDGNFHQCHSVDGGRSWSEPAQTPIWCGGSSPADLLVLADGRVLCTYGHRREPFGVRACLSEDGGASWEIGREIVLRDDGPDRDMGYPSSVQLADGRILTVYYWHGGDGVRYLEGSVWEA